MEIIKKDTKINYKEIQCLYKNIDLCSSIFFDIETTGFMAKNTHLYMIGILYVCKETNTFTTIQWFSNNRDDENDILLSFWDFIKDYKTLIHFNGKGFDIPYLEAKAELLDISIDFNVFNHIDLYKSAGKLKKFLKTENIKLKTIEQFFGLDREDSFSGKDLIAVYDEYMHKKDDILKEFLLLHNYEDINGMLTVINILAYEYIFNGYYTYISHEIDLNNNEMILEFSLETPVNCRISYSYDNIYLTAYDNKLKLLIKLYEGELKFFYDNYKDYYYLPQEDMAIHSSLATYVDKNFKEKAKKSNCYTKKSGIFAPQYSDTFTPSFKNDYKDNVSYFELTDEVLENKQGILNYSVELLRFIRDLR